MKTSSGHKLKEFYMQLASPKNLQDLCYISG